MLVSLALKKLNERVSYLVSVHCFSLGFPSGISSVIVGEILWSSKPLVRRNVAYNITKFAFIRGLIELYLTSHGQSTAIAPTGPGLERFGKPPNTGFRSAFTCLTTVVDLRNIHLTDANYVMSNVSTVCAVGGVDGLQHYQ